MLPKTFILFYATASFNYFPFTKNRILLSFLNHQSRKKGRRASRVLRETLTRFITDEKKKKLKSRFRIAVPTVHIHARMIDKIEKEREKGGIESKTCVNKDKKEEEEDGNGWKICSMRSPSIIHVVALFSPIHFAAQ